MQSGEACQLDRIALSGAENEYVFSREYAVSLDGQDSIRHIRNEFLIPSKANLRSATLRQEG
jgi:hypothetical protein